MRFSSFFVLAPIAVSSANAQRQLSQDAQFDLIFPLNGETYAPTQWFPIVFGIQNADGILSTLPTDGVRVNIGVWTADYRQNESVSGWGYALENFYSNDFKKVPIPAPAAFIHFPPINALFGGINGLQVYPYICMHNMTNGTTKSYYVEWNVMVDNKCFAPGKRINNNTWEYTRSIQFSTAPGAQLPDIEASVNSCPEPHPLSSIGLNVTSVGPKERCPSFRSTAPPIKCGYKPFAKDLAANVTAAMLGKMGCDEGDWRTITAPCPPKSGASWAATATGAAWMVWFLAMASTF